MDVKKCIDEYFFPQFLNEINKHLTKRPFKASKDNLDILMFVLM